MTKPDQPNPIALPLLLLYSKPTSPDLPQASWFRAEDSQALRPAAQTLMFSVIDIATDADRALIVGVHEGVLIVRLHDLRHTFASIGAGQASVFRSSVVCWVTRRLRQPRDTPI
jgi:hypothetical protein